MEDSRASFNKEEMIAGGGHEDNKNSEQNIPEITLYYGRGGGAFAWVLLLFVSIVLIGFAALAPFCISIISILLLLFIIYIVIFDIGNKYWVTTSRIIKAGIQGRKEMPISEFVSFEWKQSGYQEMFDVADFRLYFANGYVMKWNDAPKAGYLIPLLHGEGNIVESVIESRMKNIQK